MAGKQRGRSETIFWISFADLTTCLMMCFMLVFLCISFLSTQQQVQLKDVAEQLAEAPELLSRLATLNSRVAELESVKTDNESLKAKLAVAESKAISIDSSIRPIIEAKKQLDEALLTIAAGAQKILIDARNCEGVARFSVNLEDLAITIEFQKGNLSWFKAGSAIPERAGTECLKEFVPIWLGELYKLEQSRGFIEQLVVEGHTDSTAPNPAEAFLYNLKLSQDRALEVARFILNDADGIPVTAYTAYPSIAADWKPFTRWIKRHLTGTGRSFSRLKYRFVGRKRIEDREKSRRVEFKIVMKDQLAVLKEISESS